MYMKYEYLIYAITILIAIPIVFSFQDNMYCTPGNNCTFVFEVRDFYNASKVYTGKICEFYLYNTNGDLIFNDSMTNTSSGFQYYNFNSSAVGVSNGDYFWRVLCEDNGTKGVVSGILHLQNSSIDMEKELLELNNNIISKLNAINQSIQENQNYLTEINQTTHNTYTYVVSKWGSYTANDLYSISNQAKEIANYINQTRWNNYNFEDIMNKWGSYTATDLYSVSNQAKEIANYINQTRWNNYVASDLYSISNQAYAISNYINQTRWDTLTANDLYSLSQDIQALASNINQTVNQINSTSNLIYTTQLAYFPTWNTTFFYWNNSYFVYWNNSIMNLDNNWNTLWDKWNCDTNNNKVCDYLVDINYTVHNIKVNNTAIANAVWNYATRTLTDYNQSTIISLLNSIEDNQLAYFPTWNTTFFYWNNSYFVYWNNSIMNLDNNWSYLWNEWDCNVSNSGVCSYLYDIKYIVNDREALAKYVWNSTDRNLTYYNHTDINSELGNLTSIVTENNEVASKTLYMISLIIGLIMIGLLVYSSIVLAQRKNKDALSYSSFVFFATLSYGGLYYLAWQQSNYILSSIGGIVILIATILFSKRSD